MFAEQKVSESDDRQVFWNFYSLVQIDNGRADRSQIIGRLNGGGLGVFLQHLQGGFLTFFDGAAGIENQAVIRVDLGFAKRPAVAFEPFIRGWRRGRSGEER